MGPLTQLEALSDAHEPPARVPHARSVPIQNLTVASIFITCKNRLIFNIYHFEDFNITIQILSCFVNGTKDLYTAMSDVEQWIMTIIIS